MRITGLLSFVLATSLLAAAANCDCTIFPWKKECDKECGIASGKVKAITDDKLVLNVQKQNGGTQEETFVLNDKSLSPTASMTRSDLTKNSHITITYQKQDDGTKVVKAAGAASTN